MSEDILKQVDAALEGVTEGPWRTEEGNQAGDATIFVGVGPSLSWCPDCGTNADTGAKEAAFIVWARTGVPALAAELEAARAEAAQWKSLWQQNTENAAEAMRERDEARAEVERLKSRPIANIELSDEEAANVIRNTAEALQEARAEVERLQAGQAVRCNYPTCKADW